MRPPPDGELTRQALELWQGPQALAGVRAEFAAAARTHLEEQRNTALEGLFEAELDCGNQARIVAELARAVVANPTRERLVGQPMIALYRCGRPTDALAAFRGARQVLADDHGLEPGHQLRELERLILLGDPCLLGPAPHPPQPAGLHPAPPRSPVPAQLPLDVRGFAGRARSSTD